MEQFMEKLSLVAEMLDLIKERIELDKGGPGSGRKPSGHITDGNSNKPIVVPGKPKPVYDSTPIRVGAKPVRIRDASP